MKRSEKSRSALTGRVNSLPKPAYLDDFITIAFEAIIAYNPQKQIAFWNPAAERMYGWSSEEALGKRPTELFWPVRTPQEQEELEQRQLSLEQGETVQGEYKARCKDGSSLWVEYSSREILDEAGKVSGYVAVYRDITERKQAEEDIRRLNAGLQAQLDEMKTLLNVLPTGIWIGNEDCSIITGNRAAYEMLGLERGINASLTNAEPQTPAGLRVFLNGVELPPEDAPMQQVARSGEPLYNLEHEFLFPDGTRKAILANIVPLFDEQRKIRKIIGAYTDLTRHKQMQNEIQLISKMPAENPNPAMRLTRDGRVIYANTASTPLIELWSVQGDPIVPDELQTHVAAAFDSGLKKEIEIEHNEKTFSCTLVPIREAGYINLYANDITERKRAEAELRRNEERRSATYEHAPIGIVECSPDGHYISVNEEFCRITGYERGEVLELSFRDITYEEDFIFEVKLYGRLSTGKIPFYTIEKRYVKKDGSLIWAEITRSAVHGSNGEVLYTIGAVLDISERKQIEQELARERELLERIFNTIPVMLTIYEPSTKLLRLNTQFERLVGWSSQEAAGISLMEACYPDPDYREQVWEFMEACTENEWMDIRMQTRDGRTLETSWSNIRLSSEMQVGIGIDITERKRTEQALMESAREQEALYQFVEQLQRTNSLEEVFSAALEAILSALRCDRASILLFDKTNVMRFVAWRGLSEGYRKATDGHSPWKADAENPEPIHMNEVSSSDLSDSLKAVIQEEGITSLAFIPLVSNGKLIGKFMVYFNAPHAFSKAELELSLTIARQLAFGIDRIRAAENLRISEDRLRLAVTAGNIGIWDFDLIRRERAWSKEGKAIYGLAPDEFLDYERQLALTHPDDRARVHELVTAFRDLGSLKQLNFEHRIIRPDGSLRWVQVNGEAIYAGGDLPVRLIGTLVDITERKQAEQALRESEERFRTLANAMPSMVWTAAPDGKITYANDQWLSYVGLTFEENANQWPELVLHPDDYERCVREWTHALQTVPDEYLIEVRNRRYDGQYRWFQTRAVPVRDASGKATAWYGVTTDIHERIEAGRRLVLLAEISELMRTVEEPAELLFAVSKAVGEHLQVRRCLFNEIDLDRDIEIVHRDYCRGAPSVAGMHKISEYSSMTTAEIAAGKTIVNVDSKTDPRTARDYKSAYEPNGERAYVAVPMMRNRRWVATLWISDDTPRQWSKEEVSLLEAIAERTWTVIEKLRIAEELRAKEAELEKIINHTPFMLTRCSRDLRYRFVSRAYAEMIGRTPEEVAGRPIAEIMGEEGLRTISPYVEKVLQGDQVEYESEVPFQGKGKPFLHVVYTPERNERGEVIGWVASIVDISERRRAEEAVRASETLYRTIARSIPSGGVYVVDKNLRYIVAEGSVAEAFGFSREMLEGRTVSEMFPEKQSTRMTERLRRNFAGETISYETEHNGRFYWTQQAPLLDSIGHAIIVTIDITERKQMEEALRQSEERFARFMQHLPGLAWIKDVQGRYVYANAAAEQAFGTPRERLYGRTDQDIFPPEVAAQFEKHDELALIEGKGIQVVETLEQNDGVLHYSLVSKFPIPGPDGKTALIGGTAIDISERKKAEEALREHEKQLQLLNETLEQKVKERTAEVRRLASDLTKAEQRERHRISHILHDDLQQRVYAIQMQLAFLNDILPMENETARRELSEITQQLDEILDVTRHLSIDLSPPILRDEGLSHAIGWLAAQMREQYGLQIELQAKGSFAIPDEDLQVLLFNCVRELLFNIVKHAGVNKAVVALNWSEVGLRIEVRDQGKGFQVKEAKLREEEGADAVLRSSFGLPTIRHQLSLFGGQMEIRSEIGAGTQAIITIPVSERGLKKEGSEGN